MHKRVISFIGAIVLTMPAVAAAQGASDADVRVRHTSRIVVDQDPRPRPRVSVQGRDGREEQSETFKKSVKLGASGELDVSNITGNIEIKKGGGNEATIDVVKVARARTVEEARELLPLVKVEFNERGNRVEVRTNYPNDQDMLHNRRNVNVQVHLTITAPAGTRVTARSIAGSIRAADMTGELSLITTSGDVQVVRARRVSAAKSTSGRVEISEVDSDAPVEAGSISGDIVVNKVKASRLELSTISGQVVIQDVACDRLEAQSLSGDVEFTGPLVKGGRYELNSHSGNVKVAVAGGTGFELEANSWSGNVQSELQMTGTQPASSGRFPRRKELKGVVGDGSAILEITTFSGNVFITKR